MFRFVQETCRPVSASEGQAPSLLDGPTAPRAASILLSHRSFIAAPQGSFSGHDAALVTRFILEEFTGNDIPRVSFPVPSVLFSQIAAHGRHDRVVAVLPPR